MIKININQEILKCLKKDIKEVHKNLDTKKKLENIKPKNEFIDFIIENFDKLVSEDFYDDLQIYKEYFKKNNSTFCKEDKPKDLEALKGFLFKRKEKGKEGGIISNGEYDLKEVKKKLKDKKDEFKSLGLSSYYEDMVASKKKNKLNEVKKRLKEELSNNKSLSGILSYDNLKSDSRHKIISKLNVNVCPYCQRNYISDYVEEDQSKTTADLDHFFPKSIYPYFALSLYNFIPSCQVCNSRMKRDQDTIGAVYPYRESFDDLGAKFKVKEDKDIETILLNDSTDFEVEISLGEVDPDKVQKSINIFKLNKVYKTSHNNYIYDMLSNIKNKPKIYTDELEEMLGFESTFREILLKPYKFKIDNGEPLGKLTKDILELYKLI